MRKKMILTGIYIFVVAVALMGIVGLDHAVNTIAQSSDPGYTIVIDAGHGDPDGGAISCTGIPECKYNLEISLRLKDLLHLLGYKTVLTRLNSSSIYTKGNTIAEKKVSDLKERVRIVKDTPKALLISIHQNYFSDEIYSGAVVLYGNHTDSKSFAESIQTAFVTHLNPGSKRRAKPADGVYLMERVDCPAVLVECGFLSNSQEESKLRSAEHQKKICCILASSISEFLEKHIHVSKYAV